MRRPVGYAPCTVAMSDRAQSRSSDLARLVTDPQTRRVAEAMIVSGPAKRPPYIPLLDPGPADVIAEAQAIMSSGWDAPNQAAGRLLIRPPLAWETLCGGHRSCTYQLHAWHPMAMPLSAYGVTGEPAYLRWSLTLALDWARQHPNRVSNSEFAWYDTAVGVRAFRLAYLIDAALHAGELELDDLTCLLASVRMHQLALVPETEFRAHSNHGIYQAAGQLAAAMAAPGLPESPAAAVQGRERLRRLVDAQFDIDGAHHEHSPAYHLMVLRSLVALRAGGLIDDPSLLERLDAIEEAMSWFVAPVGVVPTVGDSDRRSDPATTDRLRNPALRFALTRGVEGTAPSQSWRVFLPGGYVVARDAWASGEDFGRSSYLLQVCGFHSRVHKHADDLSFVWYARGVDLLADPGRFGYPSPLDSASPLGQLGFYYDDPRRIYVESTRAHNCLEIDGTSYPRRGVKFYGSAIVAARREDTTGVVAIETAVRHFRTVRHIRYLFHLPGQWVLVVDHAIGSQGDAHAFAQRFKFGPELRLISCSPSRLLFGVGGSHEFLEATQLSDADPIEPVRGQLEPELQGFVSRAPGQMLPAWSAGWRRTDARMATMATLFVLTPQTASSEASARINATGRAGGATWSVNRLDHRLRWVRTADELRFAYTSERSPRND